MRPSLRPPSNSPSPSQQAANLFDNEDTNIEDMQAKMVSIQQELQALAEYYEHLNAESQDFKRQKQMIAIKTERLKNQFAELLGKLQQIQSVATQTMPSDDVNKRLWSFSNKWSAKFVLFLLKLNSNWNYW